MADENDCHKFHRCVSNGKGGFTRYDFECGNGTAWDENINTCNFENEVPSCAGQTTPPPATTEPTTTSTATTEMTPENQTGMTTTQSPTMYPTNCENQTDAIICREEGYYPHPKNCSQFYRCMDHDGQKMRYSLYHYDCPNGSIWDTNQNKCNDPARIDPPRTECQTEGTTTASPTESTTQEAETTTQMMTTTAQAETTTETTAQPETTTTTVDPETTTQAGTTEEPQTTTQAPETTTGNAETTTQVDTTTQAAETTTQPGTTEATTQEPETTTQTMETTTTAIETTTQMAGSETTTQETDTTTQAQETTTMSETTTQEPETTTQVSETTTQSPGEGSCPPMNNNQNAFICPTGFRRHPQNCSMFYQCTQEANSYNMHIVAFSCPENTVYNEDQTQCLPQDQSPPCNQSPSQRMLRGVIDQRSTVGILDQL